MNIYNNVYWISVSAESYYSGNSARAGIFVSKELWDQVDADELGTAYYYELDGKHSEVEADFSEVLLTEDNVVEVLLAWKDSYGEGYKMYESVLAEQSEGLVDSIQEFHDKFVESIQFTTIVKCKFLDKEIVLIGSN
tara:strand:- start:1055 stop:1465 length:411 start_codon:yes stop_codon:yes gene_type:complete